MSDLTSATSTSTGPAVRDDPSERLWRLWSQGQRPDVEAYLAGAGPLAPGQVAAVLRVDQRERWRCGERAPAEAYLLRHPEVAADPDCALDLIFNEFLLRERLGERPTAEEFVRRFPQHARVLREQIELHGALASPDNPAARATASPVASIRDTAPRAGDGAMAGAAFHEPQSAVDPDGTKLPEVFGRYRIVRVLGQGGMGTVYLADDTQLGRRVALKVPRFAERGEGALLERFYREARIAATFTHPHLCPVYDVGEHEGTHYLTMPFLPGEPLSARLSRQGRLPTRTAARLAALLARALQAAHEAGVVHRDLKPSNVMVNERLEPVVMDFGLARRDAPGDARVTASGVILGTPAYSAPEQIGGGAATTGPAADVYSLGVMLYEMLTGRLPFRGAVHEVLTQVLTCDPKPPSKLQGDIDPHLEALCLKALAKAPPARFASMAAFAEALEGYLRGDGLPADVTQELSCVPVAPGRRVPHLTRRRTFLALAGLGVAATGLCTWLIVGPPRETSPPDALQPGTVWSGVYTFLPDGKEHGEVTIKVTAREGQDFKGVYSTLNGSFEWLVEGSVRGQKVQWYLTKAVREEFPTNAAGTAWVEGSLNGEGMDLRYTDEDSRAKMTLRLRK